MIYVSAKIRITGQEEVRTLVRTALFGDTWENA
jgi:hypothetical protein